MSTMSQRALGCMFGGAFGDSLGAAVEFMNQDQILQTYGPAGIIWPERCYGLPAGLITDDTQQALAVGNGLIVAIRYGLTREAVNREVWRGLKAWHASQMYPKQRRAPGTTSMSALSHDVPNHERPNGNDSDSCGTVMRTHPVGLLFPSQPAKAYLVGVDIAALTHGGLEAQAAAGALSAMISVIQTGASVENAVRVATGLLRGDGRDPKVTLQLLERAVTMAKDDVEWNTSVLGDGWDAPSAVAVAVYCALRHENDFLKGVRLAVNIDGDSDSTGSICGALLGARLGLPVIPRDWTQRLERRSELRDVAVTLSAVQTMVPVALNS